MEDGEGSKKKDGDAGRRSNSSIKKERQGLKGLLEGQNTDKEREREREREGGEVCNLDKV